ncbi:MAG: phosphoribosylformylglycinamidine synthase subunit PurS [Deltaproteobacteria bacterium]|jgi:phosphoribosylformylglycinamidine synthase PurS subunit|nr:phosphoribosylformylglycinamidine synthase subunit PurS [Deltaproteobacteria bacterium]MBK8696341.1 phosphoribosylformylglycinamidine synthase subunit PurS [Deltaproteobacteria bacterium]MBP6831875.1 phosphoribosylformylglycinamidine synthase subunit PurS [Deltaproteobacteria bacterium]TAK31420.1 MAG: phosphoribosylformylglycinamidine synthase subunit PurS [Myxococcaceae bacterium]
MRARVTVTLKREVLDPQGEAIRRGFDALGLQGVREVRVGKVIEVELDDSVADAPRLLREAADKLLANPVMEDFSVEIIGPEGKTAT